MGEPICQVVIGVVKNGTINADMAAEQNFRKPCKKLADYIVYPKGRNDYHFFCCMGCANLFPHEEWIFRKVKP